jgi:hypothetical protein
MSTTLELVAQVDEFQKISDLMNDDDLTDALAVIVKMMLNPDVPPGKVAAQIVRLEAYAAKFHMLASYYTNVDKTKRDKKNLYYSMDEATRRLVDALKYMAKDKVYG